MSLRYALLALLTSEPMTGYDISRRFQSSVGHVWHAHDSQIYPELRKMEAEGLVEEDLTGDHWEDSKGWMASGKAAMARKRSARKSAAVW